MYKKIQTDVSCVISLKNNIKKTNNIVMDILPDSCLFCMKLYQDRLLTFHHWPKQIIPDRYSLAGFYYTGQSDFTICFACGLKVNQWERQDKPWDEHIRLSPDCLYLKLIGNGESCRD